MTSPATVKGGTWQIVGDGIIIDSCDVTFAVLWRAPAGDTPVATFTHHFDAGSDVNTAVTYAGTATGIDFKMAKDDQIVLHITATDASGDAMVYGLNGDGAKTGGRKPFLTLPPQ